MTTIIPVGLDDAYSDPFTLAKDEEAVLILTAAVGQAPSPRAKALVQIQADSGAWATFGLLAGRDDGEDVARILRGTGVPCRLFRPKTNSPCGVDLIRI